MTNTGERKMTNQSRRENDPSVSGVLIADEMGL
jgi:hypothetical protein